MMEEESYLKTPSGGGEEQPSLVDRHETVEKDDGTKDVRHVFAFKNLDWDKYHQHRPTYPESMWTTLYNYHREHHGQFEAVHDLGSGPGTAAATLGRTFSHVFVSDAGAANLATAVANLRPPSQFSFHHAPAEQAHTWLPPASVDFAIIAMAFHYMDPVATLSSIAATLKPGGTLAAVTYGFRLSFPDYPRVQELWFAVCSKETTRLIKEGKVFPAAVRGMARAMTGLDFVDVPEDLFSTVRRIYVNVKPEERQPFCFVDPDPAVWQPASSSVKPENERIFVDDLGWSRLTDAEWLKGFLISCQLGFDDTTWALGEWRELENIIASAPDGEVEVRWPAALLLATRKMDGLP